VVTVAIQENRETERWARSVDIPLIGGERIAEMSLLVLLVVWLGYVVHLPVGGGFGGWASLLFPVCILPVTAPEISGGGEKTDVCTLYN
jgi:hypothetical protein